MKRMVRKPEKVCQSERENSLWGGSCCSIFQVKWLLACCQCQKKTCQFPLKCGCLHMRLMFKSILSSSSFWGHVSDFERDRISTLQNEVQSLSAHPCASSTTPEFHCKKVLKHSPKQLEQNTKNHIMALNLSFSIIQAPKSQFDLKGCHLHHRHAAAVKIPAFQRV